MSFVKHSFKSPELLERALTHKSMQTGADNEKLEFLGDAVLDLILGEFLLEKYPTDTEGDLSRRRASLVNESMLASIAIEIGIPAALKLGKGEEKTGGREKPRILASAFEALMGAVFLDAGYDSTREIARRLFESRLELDLLPDFDYKSKIQEIFQAKNEGTPTYQVLSEEGPSHDRTFTVSLQLVGKPLSNGVGKSKKMAEQDAAKKAYQIMMAQNLAGQNKEEKHDL